MKVAVPSSGKSMKSEIDTRFGRASCFILYEQSSQTTTVIDNLQNLNAPQGAGVQAAQAVANSQADALLAKNVGPKAYKVLMAANIKVFQAINGTVEENLKLFEAGKLLEMEQSNVEGHWV